MTAGATAVSMHRESVLHHEQTSDSCVCLQLQDLRLYVDVQDLRART